MALGLSHTPSEDGGEDGDHPPPRTHTASYNSKGLRVKSVDPHQQNPPDSTRLGAHSWGWIGFFTIGLSTFWSAKLGYSVVLCLHEEGFSCPCSCQILAKEQGKFLPEDHARPAGTNSVEPPEDSSVPGVLNIRHVFRPSDTSSTSGGTPPEDVLSTFGDLFSGKLKNVLIGEEGKWRAWVGADSQNK